MKISNNGLRLIKHFEGCLKPVSGSPGWFGAYYCPAGKLTIGYGHTNDHGRQFNEGSTWTQAECDAELKRDMEHFEAAVERLVTVDLKQHQFDALVSFAYNCGAGALQKSTLLRKVNRSDFAGAAREFARWDKGGGRVLPGLVRRRASEALMFLGMVDQNFDGKPDELIRIEESEPLPQQVDPPTEEPLSKSTISTGAKVGTGIMGAGFVAELIKQISDLPQNVLDLAINLGKNPLFLAIFAGGGIFLYIDHRRKVMKREQGV